MILESIENAQTAAQAAFFATRMCETPEEREAASQVLADTLARFPHTNGVAQIIVESGNADFLRTAIDNGIDMTAEHIDTLHNDREKLTSLINRIGLSLSSSASQSL